VHFGEEVCPEKLQAFIGGLNAALEEEKQKRGGALISVIEGRRKEVLTDKEQGETHE